MLDSSEWTRLRNHWHHDCIATLAFCPDKLRTPQGGTLRTSLVATGGKDGNIRLWDYENKLLASLSVPVEKGQQDVQNYVIDCVEFATTGQILAASIYRPVDDDAVIAVWQIRHDVGDSMSDKAVYLLKYTDVPRIFSLGFFPAVMDESKLGGDDDSDEEKLGRSATKYNFAHVTSQNSIPEGRRSRSLSRVGSRRRLSVDLNMQVEMQDEFAEMNAASGGVAPGVRMHRSGSVVEIAPNPEHQAETEFRMVAGGENAIVVLRIKQRLEDFDDLPFVEIGDEIIRLELSKEEMAERMLKKAKSKRKKKRRPGMYDEDDEEEKPGDSYEFKQLSRKQHDAWITCLRVSSSGHYVVTGDNPPEDFLQWRVVANGPVKAYHQPSVDSEEVFELQPESVFVQTPPANKLSKSEAARINKWWVHHKKGWSQIRRLDEDNHEEQLLALVEPRCSITLWSVVGDHLTPEHVGMHSNHITGVAFTSPDVNRMLADNDTLKPDEAFIASCSLDETTKLWLWNTRNGRVSHHIEPRVLERPLTVGQTQIFRSTQSSISSNVEQLADTGKSKKKKRTKQRAKPKKASGGAVVHPAPVAAAAAAPAALQNTAAPSSTSSYSGGKSRSKSKAKKVLDTFEKLARNAHVAKEAESDDEAEQRSCRMCFFG